MCERVHFGLSNILVLRQIPISVEPRVWIAALRRAELEIVYQRIHPGLRYVRILRQLPNGMEEWIWVSSLRSANFEIVNNRIYTRSSYVWVFCCVPNFVKYPRLSNCCERRVECLPCRSQPGAPPFYGTPTDKMFKWIKVGCSDVSILREIATCTECRTRIASF